MRCTPYNVHCIYILYIQCCTIYTTNYTVVQHGIVGMEPTGVDPKQILGSNLRHVRGPTARSKFAARLFNLQRRALRTFQKDSTVGIVPLFCNYVVSCKNNVRFKYNIVLMIVLDTGRSLKKRTAHLWRRMKTVVTSTWTSSR